MARWRNIFPEEKNLPSRHFFSKFNTDMEGNFKTACRKNNVHSAECLLNSKQIKSDLIIYEAYTAYKAATSKENPDHEAKEVAVVLLDYLATNDPIILNANEKHRHMIEWYFEGEWDSGSEDEGSDDSDSDAEAKPSSSEKPDKKKSGSGGDEAQKK